MARGRKPKLDPSVAWKLSIPKSLADWINDFLADPLTNQPPLGARSNLTIQLYRDFKRAADSPIKLNDDEFLAKLKAAVASSPKDYELNHVTMDSLIVQLLKDLGYEKSATFFTNQIRRYS